MFKSVAAILLLALASLAPAAVIYDNGPISPTLGATQIGGPGSVDADSFDVAATSTVGAVRLGLWMVAGNTPDSLSWAISTDTAFGQPIASGASALTPHLAGQTVYFGQTFDLYYAYLDTGSVTLNAGRYWLSVGNGRSTLPDDEILWSVSDGPSFNINGAASHSFAVLTAVPEPAVWVSLAAGLAFIGLLARRRT